MSSSSKYLVFLVLMAACTAQKKTTQVSNADQLASIKSHVQFLADDRLEGRRAGSPGEKLAMGYIADQFKAIGIEAKGTDGYFQAFDINEGRQIDKGTTLTIGDMELAVAKEFFPFPFSGSKTVNAKPAIAIQEPDMPWFIDLKEALEENKNNPHFDLSDYIYTNSKKVLARGATAIIIYNSTETDDKLVFNPKDKSEPLSIPVVYVSKALSKKLFRDPSATLDIKLSTNVTEKKRKGHNVIGYINNSAVNTVILGAHFDHLGYGEDGNSMLRNATPQIHNGADDNASGTAALIELSRMLKASDAKNNNYLFIAFSGEELGLFGSKYFTEHPTVDLTRIDYMINMDMVGRFNDTNRVLTVGGVGTSPGWSDVYSLTPTDPRLMKAFAFKYDSSGTGPSDHTSFYRKDIPVLFYFTGLHTDYHKPSDDADKINYTGEQMIIRHIYGVITNLDKKGKLTFTKTKEAATTTTANFKVTLGIMPDYTFSGNGVRADGVTEGRPAAKAGLVTGDVILQLGDHVVNSMEAYMQALGKFKKGDKTKVKYKRGEKTLEAPIEF